MKSTDMGIVEILVVRNALFGLFAIFCLMVFLVCCFFIGRYAKKKLPNQPIHIPAPEFQKKYLGDIDHNKPICYIRFNYITDGNPSLQKKIGPRYKYAMFIRELAKDYNVFVIHPDILNTSSLAYDLNSFISYCNQCQLPIKRIINKYNISLIQKIYKNDNRYIYYIEEETNA